jgi:DNA polymerase III subunit epsilon
MMNTNPSSRQRAAEIARKVLETRPVYLDTETTGLDRSDEIIEISIIDDDGQLLFGSLVKPTQSIPAASTRIHGICDADVRSSLAWPLVWQQVKGVLFEKTVVIYNESFDLRLMQQSHTRHRLTWKEQIKSFDLLKLYAEFRGEWDPVRRSYRYHSLANAGAHCGISLPNAHRATADTLLTRAVLHFIADQYA